MMQSKGTFRVSQKARIEYEKTLIKRLVEKEFQKAGLDSQSFDIEAHYDSSLNYHEAKQEIADKLRAFIQEHKKEKLKHKEHEAHLQEVQMQEYEAKVKEEWEKELIAITEQKEVDVEKHFKVVKDLVRAVLQSPDVHSLFLISEAGFGKSFLMLKTLKEMKVDIAYLNTYSTPLALYEFFFDNQDKSIILDDVEGIFNSPLNVGMLKSALWGIGEKRYINYNTSKDIGMPKRFEFKGKVFLLSNTLNLNDENIKAVIDRGYLRQLEFSYKEKIKLLFEFAKLPYEDLTLKERVGVAKWVKENTSEATINLNFRTLPKLYALFSLYRHSDGWKDLAKEVLRDNETLAMVREAMRSSGSVKEQVRNFVEVSGLGRTSYFKYRKLLR